MNDESTERRVVLGDWVFDLETGELTAPGNEGSVRRLPPQPAKLLALLIAKQGALLSRDEIRAHLWGDVEVDFDQSLSFCVRQVRSALGDSAEAPRYVETLPRRGYRLLEASRPLVVEPLPSASSKLTKRPRVTRVARVVAAVAVVLGLLGALVWLVHAIERPPSKPLRLAIMPFAPPADSAVVGDPKRIAFELLASLAKTDLNRLAVLGPSTTAAYAKDLQTVHDLVLEHEIDFVINGRFLASGSETELLVELIRGADGAHVWVERFSGEADWLAVASQVETVLRAELQLPPDG